MITIEAKILKIDLSKPMNTKDLKQLFDLEETTRERHTREINDFKNKIIETINLELLTSNSHSASIYIRKVDCPNIANETAKDICEEIEREFERKGFDCSSYRYAESNRSQIYNLYVKY